MDFKVRRIRRETRRPRKNPLAFFGNIFTPKKATAFTRPDNQKNKYTLHLATAAGSLLVIFILVFGIYSVIKSLDFSSIVFSFGKTLQTDENGHTNIMLIGIGGEGHDGANLTDTIIVAGLDYENKVVPMLSIPRDLYIMSDEYGRQRINSVYYSFLSQYGKKEGIHALKKLVGEITGREIQYYALVNFQGFKDIVDSLGGIDVMVEEAIYDPKYPKGETIYYETFKIDAGLQHLDGETALKYARSRSTTGDYNRAKRQQTLLYAIRDRAFSMDILTDAGKIKSLYDSVAESIDTNLSLAEILELAKLSKEFNKEDIFPAVLNDDPTSCGGLLYTPAREYFDGAAVLLPAGGGTYSYIHEVTDTLFNHTKTVAAQEEIQVLNGTKTPGLAAVTMNLLLRNCLNVTYYGNASNRELTTSTIYYKPGPEGEEPLSLALVKKLVPLPVVAGIPPEYTESEKRQNATIVIELGSDYLEIKPEEPYNTLKFLTAPASATAASSSTSEESSGNDATADGENNDDESGETASGGESETTSESDDPVTNTLSSDTGSETSGAGSSASADQSLES